MPSFHLVFSQVARPACATDGPIVACHRDVATENLLHRQSSSPVPSLPPAASIRHACIAFDSLLPSLSNPASDSLMPSPPHHMPSLRPRVSSPETLSYSPDEMRCLSGLPAASAKCERKYRRSSSSPNSACLPFDLTVYYDSAEKP